MNEPSIALIHPIVQVGKALRIQKSPTGIQFLSAQLKQEGYPVRMYHRPVDDDLFQDLRAFNPKYVGISAMSVEFPAAMEIAQRIKRFNEDVTVILGGWHASGCAVSYMNGYETWSLEEILNPTSPFDFVGVGEGDYVLPKLIQRLEEVPPENIWSSLQSMFGIGYLDPRNGEIQVKPGERVFSMDPLPDPDWEGLDIDIYRDGRTHELDLSLHAQRGCRFRCTFCQTPDTVPGKGTRFSVERVVDYIEFMVNKFEPEVITFTDEDFMANLTWLEELCREIVRRNLQGAVKFDSFATITDILRSRKRGTLKFMKDAGFSSYFAGIESLNKPTLKAYDRVFMQKWDVPELMKKIQAAVDLSNSHGLEFLGDYIIGYFMESEEEIRQGFNRLKALRGIRYVYLPIFTPLPGTPMWKEAIDHDMLIKDGRGRVPWELYDCSHHVTKVPYDLTALREELEQDYYTTPGYVEDIQRFVAENPAQLGEYYIPLFRRLNRDYPNHIKIERILTKLEKWSNHDFS